MSRNEAPQPLQPVTLMNPAFIATPDPLLAKAASAWLAGLIDVDPFRLTLTWNTLPASGISQQAQIAVDAGIDLLALRLSLVAYTAAGTILANPDYLLELFDGSGPWQDVPHHVQLWTGQYRNSSAGAAPFTVARYVRGSNNFRGSSIA